MNLEQIKKEYEGSLDITLEISLYEYGLIHKEEDHGEYKFIYGVSSDGESYNLFDWGYCDEDEFKSLIESSWFELDAVLGFVGMTKDEWLNISLPFRIRDCISYYGCQNIFGVSYYPFEIV